MGAELKLRSNSGTFDLNAIRAKIATFPGVVVDASNRNLFSLSGGTSPQPEEKHFNFYDTNEPEHRWPLILVSEEEVKIAINWSDDTHGSLKNFLAWLLTTYDCSARDQDSHEYESSAACQEWIELWLPNKKTSK